MVERALFEIPLCRFDAVQIVESGADIELTVPSDENALIQASGAGHYLVIRGVDRIDYVYMHLRERSPLVKGDGLRATIPGFWVMGALLAWAVHWRWVGGLAAGLVLSAVDLSVRQDIAQVNYANAFLLVLGGTPV